MTRYAEPNGKQDLQCDCAGGIPSPCHGPVSPALHHGLPVPDAARTGGLRAVLRDQRGAILRFLAARSGSADLAQDLFQELWLRLDNADQGPVANPVAYLMRAANNLMLDYRRGELRAWARDAAWLVSDNPAMQAPELLADPAPAADDMIAARQEAALMRRAIATLPPGARRALTLHRFDGLPHAEVAAVMGISRSGVEKHIAVAMKHLRRAVMNWGEASSTASDSQSDMQEPRHD